MDNVKATNAMLMANIFRLETGFRGDFNSLIIESPKIKAENVKRSASCVLNVHGLKGFFS